MSYETALRSWLSGKPPTLAPYAVARARQDDEPLASATVLHEGPLWTTSSRVHERDLWWLRLDDHTVVACVQVCTPAVGASKLVALTVRQQETLWAARLAAVRRDPLWRNERVLPSGTVVPEIPHDFVARREERSDRTSTRREARVTVAKSMVPRLNRVLWHVNAACLPTADEMAQTTVLWPAAFRRPCPGPSLAVAGLERRVRQDGRQAALLDARAANIARMDEVALAADPHAATILACRVVFAT